MNKVQKILHFCQKNTKRVITWAVIFLCVLGLFAYYQHSGFSLEEFITQLWENHVEDWGYVILFFGVSWRVS